MLTIQELFTLENTIAAPLFAGKQYPWEVLADIEGFILELGKTLPMDEFHHPADASGKPVENIWIANDATVYPSAFIKGPCIIDHGAELRHSAFVRGNAIVGKKTVVGNSVELKNVVLFDNCEVPHFNYVGDSVLGFHAHMGAGSITSNVRADRALVTVHDHASGKGEEEVFTNRKKVGAFLGDYAEIGCNAVLNPGTVVGPHSQVYPTSCVRGTVPSDNIFTNTGEIRPRRED